MVTTTFGDMLFCPKSDYLGEFPSPEALKRKVMISTKPPEYRESSHHMKQTSMRKGNKVHSEDKSEDDQDDDEDEDDYDDDEDGEGDEDNAVPEYKELIAIHAGKPKGKPQRWLSDEVKVKRLSLSEQELEDAAMTNRTDIVR